MFNQTLIIAVIIVTISILFEKFPYINYTFHSMVLKSIPSSACVCNSHWSVTQCLGSQYGPLIRLDGTRQLKRKILNSYTNNGPLMLNSLMCYWAEHAANLARVRGKTLCVIRSHVCSVSCYAREERLIGNINFLLGRYPNLAGRASGCPPTQNNTKSY